ncbi:MAG: site-2 protease family protein [Gemmatirosa sp.]
MKWSWRIARIAGIDVHVHATFVLLLGFYALSAYQRTRSYEASAMAVGFVALVFAIVLMHEYGHALAARRYGIATQDITLLPIGGVARLERMPREPRQELVVALAGPAVNVVLAVLLWAGLRVFGGTPAPMGGSFAADEGFFSHSLAEQLLRVNVWLAAFNMIPAFPMDGGRVLRAVIAWRTGDYARATVRAAAVGRFFALLFGLIGFFVTRSPMLVLVALFVWMAAASEADAVSGEGGISELPLSRVMITDVRTVGPDEPLGRAVELMLAGFQQDFPVIERGALIGVLTRRDLLQALRDSGADAPVRGAMRTDYAVAAPDEPLEDALARLKGCGCQAMPVVRGQTLLGLLTLDNVGEYVMVRSALRGSRA